MLTDAGPIIAIIDEGDADHDACMSFLTTLPKAPLQTTWACFTEAMYLLESVGGYRFQERLWRWRRDARLVLLDITEAEADRMDVLVRYPLLKHGGLQIFYCKPILTRLSTSSKVLRYLCHNTLGCVPVPGSVVQD